MFLPAPWEYTFDWLKISAGSRDRRQVWSKDMQYSVQWAKECAVQWSDGSKDMQYIVQGDKGCALQCPMGQRICNTMSSGTKGMRTMFMAQRICGTMSNGTKDVQYNVQWD